MTAKATLVGEDASTDTAVIKVSVPAGKLTPLAFADSSTVSPGEGVVAIGSPFGYAESITAGIVSGVDRDIQAPNGYTIPNTIQTDAADKPRQLGRSLIDSSGKVIGTNVQIAVDGQSGDGANAGVGFAVPSNTVKSVVADLIAGKAVQHAYLGVAVGDSASGGGAQVGTVRAGSPAAAAGLKQGDVITAIDGATVTERQPADLGDQRASARRQDPPDGETRRCFRPTHRDARLTARVDHDLVPGGLRSGGELRRAAPRPRLRPVCGVANELSRWAGTKRGPVPVATR